MEKFEELKHLIDEWAVELINNGMVDFKETIGIYYISGKVKDYPSVSILLGNDGDVSITITPLIRNKDLKHVYEAEKQHILENELKKKIQELEEQVEKAKNAAD